MDFIEEDDFAPEFDTQFAHDADSDSPEASDGLDAPAQIASDFSRRNFLRYTAAGAAALWLPSYLRSAYAAAPYQTNDALERARAVAGIEIKPAIAKTAAGQIRGQLVSGVYNFKGVPYGMDTAKTRFMAPKPPDPWEGVRDCLTWGPRTIQPGQAAPANRGNNARRGANANGQTSGTQGRRGRNNANARGRAANTGTSLTQTGVQQAAASANAQANQTANPLNAPVDPRFAGQRNYSMPPDLGGQSEDCLNLNVWTRGLRDGKKRPVMVYFHGGGYTYGTSNSDLYDGTRLAQRGDVVVVTVNGRLNAFGFLYLAELGGPSFADSGMAGQLDLVLALQWVRDNIAEFGGDPDRVLIFGQSGGGGKCATLTAMPPARGLFHRVVCMSGQLIAGTPAAAATERARAVLKALNLEPGNIDAIRTMPMEQIRQATVGGNYGPVADGRSLPTGPFWPQAAEQSLDVPIIFGNTHDETRFLGADPGNITWDEVVPRLQGNAPPRTGMWKDFDPADLVAKYRQWYPAYSPRDVYFQITTDLRVWRSEQVAADMRAKNPTSQAKTWVYEMDWVSPAGGGRFKAPHTMDLPFAFDNCALAPGMVGSTPELQARAQKLADAVSETYIAFAKTGNPNNPHIPTWPTFNLKDQPTLIFDDKVQVVNDPRKPQREVIQAVPFVPNQG